MIKNEFLTIVRKLTNQRFADLQFNACFQNIFKNKGDLYVPNSDIWNVNFELIELMFRKDVRVAIENWLNDVTINNTNYEDIVQFAYNLFDTIIPTNERLTLDRFKTIVDILKKQLVLDINFIENGEVAFMLEYPVIGNHNSRLWEVTCKLISNMFDDKTDLFSTWQQYELCYGLEYDGKLINAGEDMYNYLSNINNI